MNIPVSFGSTYIVTNANPKAAEKFQTYCLNKELTGQAGYRTQSEHHYKYRNHTKVLHALVAPFLLDEDIESFCIQNNIIFTKYTNHTLVDEKNIRERIMPPPRGMHLIEIDSDNFENYIGSSDKNFKKYSTEYYEKYQKEANTMLKSGFAFPASTLVAITTPKSSTFDFKQRTQDFPDKYSYLVLKETGIKKIPVYVNDYTEAKLRETGIISD